MSASKYRMYSNGLRTTRSSSNGLATFADSGQLPGFPTAVKNDGTESRVGGRLNRSNRKDLSPFVSPPVPFQKIPVRSVSETARPKGFVTRGTQMPPCTIAANGGGYYGTSE